MEGVPGPPADAVGAGFQVAARIAGAVDSVARAHMVGRLSSSIVTVSFVLAFAAPFASAQSVGIKVGSNVSWLVFDDGFGETTEPAAGLTGGGVLSVGLPGPVRVRLEGLYTLERTRVNDGPSGRLTFIDVPLLVGVDVPWAVGTDRVSLEAGVVYRRLVDARESLGGESYSIKRGVRREGMLIAAGVAVPLRERWSLDLRYLHGLDDVFRRGDGGFSGAWRSVHVAAAYALLR